MKKTFPVRVKEVRYVEPDPLTATSTTINGNTTIVTKPDPYVRVKASSDGWDRESRCSVHFTLYEGEGGVLPQDLPRIGAVLEVTVEELAEYPSDPLAAPIAITERSTSSRCRHDKDYICPHCTKGAPL